MKNKFLKTSKRVPKISIREVVTFSSFLVIFYVLFTLAFFIFHRLFYVGELFGSSASSIELQRMFLLIAPVLLSVWAALKATRIVNGPSGSSEREYRQPSKVTVYTLSTIIVLSGLAAGFVIGFLISFGACFKSDCNVLEESAPITVPAASLFFTVPASRKLLKKHKQNEQQRLDRSSTD